MNPTRRVPSVIAACVIVSTLATVSVMRLSTPDDRPTSNDASAQSYRTGQQVILNSVSYGLAKISTPGLESQGIVCVPAPVDSPYDTEEWPDSPVQPDPAHRAGLPVNLQEAYDCMLNCLPTDPANWSGPSLSAARPCFESKVLELTKSVGLVDTFTALGAMLKTYPKITFFCHKAGHAAGEAAVESGIDMKTALVAVRDYCVHGAVHGLFDGFARTNPTIDDFRSVAKICESLDGPAAGGCTDGLGHAAWDTFKAIGPAADACGTVGLTDLRYLCDEGILMRKYERDDPGLISTPDEFTAFTAKLRNDCAEWASASTARSTDEFGPGTGCYAGVQYMLWLYPTQLSREFETERWRKVENFQAYLDEVIATCASFGTDGEALCRRRDGNAVAVLANYKTEDFEVLCKMLKDNVEACIKQAFDLTRYNSGETRQ